MQGLFFNNREWFVLFFIVDYMIIDGVIDVIFIEISKIFMFVKKNICVFIVVI